MSWLDNFKAPSPAPPEQPPPAYEAAIRDDDPSGTAEAPEIDPPSSSTEDASAARVDPPREAPEPETDAPTAPEPSPGTSGPARPDPDLEPPRPAEPTGTSPIAVPSLAEGPKGDAAAAADATIRSLRSELAVSAAAAEDATAALEAMTLKADTLARLLDEASSCDAKDASSSSSRTEKMNDECRALSARLETSESKRAELESAVTLLETRVVSLTNDLSAAREIARSTGELADQSATYIAELKKKHRAVETRERELSAELDRKNAEVRDVRKNTHDSKLETEQYRLEHVKQTERIATLETKLKTAEDALEDERVFSERGAVSALRDELEACREERRALLDASQDFSRRLRDAEDAAADAELRAADAELACEAVRAEAAAELERETEKLRTSNSRRREQTSFVAEREKKKKSSFSREEDDEDAVVALEDAERRARDAEARARALEAELRDRDEGANATGPAPNPDATKSSETDSELDEKEYFHETRRKDALRLSLERATSRAERAERALEAAQLLARPSSVTESDAELVRLRDAGKRAAETERILRETRLKLEACEARLRDEETKRLSAESDARVLVERVNEREADLMKLRESERIPTPARSLRTPLTATTDKNKNETDESSLRLAHAKAMTLRFLEAPSFDEQQAVLPVLAAVQNWDPSERRAVDKARALYWEPAEKVLADRLSAMAEVDLGVTSATNALAGALGLGNVL